MALHDGTCVQAISLLPHGKRIRRLEQMSSVSTQQDGGGLEGRCWTLSIIPHKNNDAMHSWHEWLALPSSLLEDGVKSKIFDEIQSSLPSTEINCTI